MSTPDRTDPIALALDELDWALAESTIYNEDMVRHVENAIAALSRLHTEREWPCGCEEIAGPPRTMRYCVNSAKCGSKVTPAVGYLLYDEPTTGAQ